MGEPPRGGRGSPGRESVEARTNGLWRKPAPWSLARRFSWGRRLSTSARRPRWSRQAASRKAARSLGDSSTVWWKRASAGSPAGSVMTRLLGLGREGLPELPGQPGPGVAPVALDRADRPADDARRLFEAQAGEV